MAELFKERGKQAQQKPDIADMIARATESIRARSGQPASQPVENRRALDPQIYGDQQPQKEQKHTQPKAPNHENYSQPQPLISPEVIRELDMIFRARATQAAPQRVESTAPSLALMSHTIEPPVIVEQPSVELMDASTPDAELTIPAPGTNESVIFEYELRKAQNIIARAQEQGYKPQLPIDSFSPEVVAFLRACGQGPYLVNEIQPRTASIAGLVSQATLATQNDRERRATNQPRANKEKRPMSPKMRKRLIGAVATVTTSFVLFTGSYIGAREVICKPTDLGAKLGCTGLALNANFMDGIPVVNTLSAIWRGPIETYNKIVGNETAQSEAPNGAKR